MSRRVTFTAIAALLACALSNPTLASLVTFDLTPDVPVTPGGVIPGGTTPASPYTYSIYTFAVDGGADDLQLRTARADAVGGPGVDQVVIDGFNDSQIIIKGDNSYLNTPFVLGDVIGDGLDEFARDPNQFSVINDGFTPATVLAGDNYVGFKLTTGAYGFLRYNYDPNNMTFTFLDGAYDPSGAAVTVSAVPEPGSFACLGLVSVLCGGFCSRRGRSLR